jgi:hypothetical protein
MGFCQGGRGSEKTGYVRNRPRLYACALRHHEQVRRALAAQRVSNEMGIWLVWREENSGKHEVFARYDAPYDADLRWRAFFSGF